MQRLVRRLPILNRKGFDPTSSIGGIRTSATAAANKALGIKEQVGHVRLTWQDGKWGELEWLHGANSITLNTFASCLHYANNAFEGFKAFRVV